MLATVVQECPFEWEGHLRHLRMAYNISVHPTTGYTSFYLMFGCQARMPIDIMYGTPSPQASSHVEYVHGATSAASRVSLPEVCLQLGQKLS